MTRALLQSLLLFLLPFLGYALYVMLMRRGQGWLASTPWFWLSMGGLCCVIFGFIGLIVTGGAAPGSIYVPPHLDAAGQVVPAGKAEHPRPVAP